MFPWRRKHRPFYFWDEDFFSDDFFRDLEDEFREMEENITRIFNEARKAAQKKPGEGGPFVYGFSMRIGPDGKPHVEEFGNIPELKAGTERLELTHREPLTDIIEKDKEILVVAEIPGVEKNEINLDVTDDALTISVNTERRKYHKELKLPYKVKTDSAKATYKNGILEVKLEKIEEKKPEKKGVKIKVE
ncbi:MAG: archaeal heat shock protein Hsp20 [Candidatus Altiarchaeota archaeon]